MDLQKQIDSLLLIVEGMAFRIQELEQENKELRERLEKDSSNSSFPPSSDSIFKRSDRRSDKKTSKRKAGGQQGHKGYKLKKFDQVDFYEDHVIPSCPNCESTNLKKQSSTTRQVVDIPVTRMHVTEHTFHSYHCANCNQNIKNAELKNLPQTVQYGPRIKAFVCYMNTYQIVPYKRLVELIETLYGHRISQGSISNFTAGVSKNLAGFIARLKENMIQESQVVHSDETGIIVDGKVSWTHVYSTRKLTLLAPHAKRGKEAMEAIGVLPKLKGTLIHDRFSSYQGYGNANHGLCNAHLLRDIKAAYEQNNLNWLEQIKKLLLRAKRFKENGQLTKYNVIRLQNKYEKILRDQRDYYQKIEEEIKQSKRGKPKRSKDHNLHIALWKYRNEILRFIHEQNVPFDNNQAERDLRMLKVKMKVSNLFKTLNWAQVHCNIRSYIATLQKQERNIFDNLVTATINPDFKSNLTV